MREPFFPRSNANTRPLFVRLPVCQNKFKCIFSFCFVFNITQFYCISSGHITIYRSFRCLPNKKKIYFTKNSTKWYLKLRVRALLCNLLTHHLLNSHTNIRIQNTKFTFRMTECFGCFFFRFLIVASVWLFFIFLFVYLDFPVLRI